MSGHGIAMRPTDDVPIDPADADEADAPVPDGERPIRPPGAGSGSGPVPDAERPVPPDDLDEEL